MVFGIAHLAELGNGHDLISFLEVVDAVLRDKFKHHKRDVCCKGEQNKVTTGQRPVATLLHRGLGLSAASALVILQMVHWLASSGSFFLPPPTN